MGACFGGSTALLVTLVYTKLSTGKAMWDLIMATNGALTGMVVSFYHPSFSPLPLTIRATNGALTGMMGLQQGS